MIWDWLKNRKRPKQIYVRQESKEIAAFYKPYARFQNQSPPDVGKLVTTLADKTRLHSAAAEYPTEDEAIASAGTALCQAVSECYRFDLDYDSPDSTQMDRLTDYLIDPQLRPFFENGKPRKDMSEAEAAKYMEARDSISIPNEPLLYYALGAFYCLWLVRHRQAEMCLYSPLRPIQSFPDMITVGPTICLHPFSQVTKRLSDPEGDNLEFKVSSRMTQGRMPPFPLLASLADAEFAALQLLPPTARHAREAERQDQVEQAFRLYAKAIADDPNNLQVLSMGSACALKLRQYDAAMDWMELILSMQPKSPLIMHNLAILYGGPPGRSAEAIRLLKDAIEFDPYYARARITLASFLLDAGSRQEAIAQAEWVLKNDSNLKNEAARFLQEAGAS